MKVITREITAHIIITNVNKSLNVTMDIIPFRNVRGCSIAQSASWLGILFNFAETNHNKLLYKVVITCYNMLSKRAVD